MNGSPLVFFAYFVSMQFFAIDYANDLLLNSNRIPNIDPRMIARIPAERRLEIHARSNVLGVRIKQLMNEPDEIRIRDAKEIAVELSHLVKEL